MTSKPNHNPMTLYWYHSVKGDYIQAHEDDTLAGSYTGDTEAVRRFLECPWTLTTSEADETHETSSDCSLVAARRADGLIRYLDHSLFHRRISELPAALKRWWNGLTGYRGNRLR